jgi:hypothetical protein
MVGMVLQHPKEIHGITQESRRGLDASGWDATVSTLEIKMTVQACVIARRRIPLRNE